MQATDIRLPWAFRANSNVTQSLYNKATDGDTIAVIFWLKCRAHWKGD
jgi:hypothetical protein